MSFSETSSCHQHVSCLWQAARVPPHGGTRWAAQACGSGAAPAGRGERGGLDLGERHFCYS